MRRNSPLVVVIRNVEDRPRTNCTVSPFRVHCDEDRTHYPSSSVGRATWLPGLPHCHSAPASQVRGSRPRACSSAGRCASMWRPPHVTEEEVRCQTPEDPESDDLKKRQRELVDKLLAEAPVAGSGLRSVRQDASGLHHLGVVHPVVPPALDKDGDAPQAAVFTFAHSCSGDATTTRPVCFAFNGGPGSSSVWLHLWRTWSGSGCASVRTARCRRRRMCSKTIQTPGSNTSTSCSSIRRTRASQSASEEARKKHFSVDGDITALAEVVRGWLHRHNRWSSPLYLAGELRHDARCRHCRQAPGTRNRAGRTDSGVVRDGPANAGVCAA